MHVGVEEAVAHRVREEAAQDDEAELAAIVAGGVERGVVGDRDPVDPFERQHALGGAQPIDVGHAEAFGRRDVLRHLRDGGSLEPQVHLELGGTLQVLTTATGRRRRDGAWKRSIWRAAK